MVEDVLVLLLDLLARLVGKVVLKEGEVSAEADNELSGSRSTSQSKFSSPSDHFLL